MFEKKSFANEMALNMEKQLSDHVNSKVIKNIDKNNLKQDNLTSEKMVNNLKDHGTVFNLVDDGKFNKLDNYNFDDNNLDDLALNDKVYDTFEDE